MLRTGEVPRDGTLGSSRGTSRPAAGPVPHGPDRRKRRVLLQTRWRVRSSRYLRSAIGVCPPFGGQGAGRRRPGMNPATPARRCWGSTTTRSPADEPADRIPHT